MTVEASFVMPLVCMLYFLIIISGFYLYDRCVMSQDQYMLAVRGSRFTESAYLEGTVIYGEMKMDAFDRQYTEERLFYKQSFYPLFEKGTGQAVLKNGRVKVSGFGFRGLLEMEKEAERINPLAVIRERRRRKYA